jgi:hypothetical protein
MKDGDGSDKVPVQLVTFPLSGLPGVSYLLERVFKLITLNI